MTIFLTALAVWAVTGVVVAAILARHGHPLWIYALIGLAFGPFLLLVWFKGAWGQNTKSLPVREAGAPNADGWIDVLVGLDGTAQSVQSIDHVITTLGRSVRRVQLTSAVDHEIVNTPEAFETDDRRAAYLREAAQTLRLDDAEISLVSGQPDRALRDHAEANGFDLIVVAHRRRPVLSGLRGSTVGRLARTSELPVLIGPPARV